MKSIKVPRWYQELSHPQIDMVCILGKAIKLDQEEKITDRTQRVLKDIGVTSTFVRLSSKDIKNLWTISDSDPVKFLCEIYRFVTGNSFEEEAYKNFYDCNERLILSSIAFLKLPETIIELQRRLPTGKLRKIPPKPTPPKVVLKRNPISPYLERPVGPPDWRTYRNELRKWEEIRRTTVNPRVIIPPLPLLLLPESRNIQPELKKDPKILKSTKEIPSLPPPPSTESKSTESEFNKNSPESKPPKERKKKMKERQVKEESVQSVKISSAPSPTVSTISEVNEKIIEPVSRETLKDNEGEVANAKINEEIRKNVFHPQLIDLTHQHVDSYFNVVSKKTYPLGRENLSWKWQDWFFNIDECYTKLEKEANVLLKSVRETSRKIFDPDVCDNCCACREIRATERKSKKLKNPNLIIDNVIADETGKRYVVGSLGIISPPQTISDSSLTKPLIIPSEDEIMKKTVIESIALDERGQPIYHTAGFTKQINHIPQKIIAKPPLPRKNVPSCNCKAATDDSSEDDESVDKENQCTAEKYRKRGFNKCRPYSDNKIFMEFETIMRQKDKREEKARKEMIEMKERLLNKPCKNVPEIAVTDEPEECEKCSKCSPEKCQPSPLKGILEEIIKEREAQQGKKKPSKKSGIKEYRENLRFAIGGVAGNDDVINEAILSGVTVHTPITITPESSESESDIIYRSMSQHHHWSVTQFTPKSAPKDREIMKEYSGKTEVKFNDNKKTADIQIQPLPNETKIVDTNRPVTINYRKKIVKTAKKTQSMKKIEKRKELISIESEGKISSADDYYDDNDDDRQNEEKGEIRSGREERNEGKEEIWSEKEERNKEEDEIRREEEEEKYEEKDGKNTKKNLPKLMKKALRKMAEEGYLFAKLPHCYDIPPLQAWIMYRNGFKLNEKFEKDLLDKSLQAWESCEAHLYKKITAPKIELSEKQKTQLNYNQINKIKRKIAAKKKIFHSNVRKSRVLQSRSMWNLMEYGIYPNVNFKKSYFIYQVSKEADGHILRPYGFEAS